MQLAELVADGIDPNAQRQARRPRLATPLKSSAREWLKLLENGIKASTLERERSQLERFVFPELGSRPIAQITTPEILEILKKIEARGHGRYSTSGTQFMCAHLALRGPDRTAAITSDPTT